MTWRCPIWKPSGHHVDLVGQAQEAMILSMTSVQIVLPVVLALATTRKILSLPPVTRCALWGLLTILVCSCSASICAWYKWNCFVGMLDQILALTVVTSSMIFACTRVKWVARLCLFLALMSAFAYCIEVKLESIGLPRPWPHLIFRLFACLAVTCSVNGWLLYPNAIQFLTGGAIFGVVTSGYCYIEWIIAMENPNFAFTKDCFFGGLARCTAVMLVTAALMVFVPPRFCPSPSRNELLDDISEDDELEKRSEASDFSDDQDSTTNDYSPQCWGA